jgi:hypothetical protein
MCQEEEEDTCGRGLANSIYREHILSTDNTFYYTSGTTVAASDAGLLRPVDRSCRYLHRSLHLCASRN